MFTNIGIIDNGNGGGGNTGDLPNASTNEKGIVQLSSATNSTAENLASTPKAIYDAINISKQHATTLVTNLIANAPANLDDLNEIVTAIQELQDTDVDAILQQLGQLQLALNDKAEKVHEHLASEITDLATVVQGIIDNIQFNLDIADINGLSTQLNTINNTIVTHDGKIATLENRLDNLPTPQDGVDGKDGVDGDSAYQIAVNNGFVGTEQQWLNSLKGQDGVDGKDGVDGTDATVTEQSIVTALGYTPLNPNEVNDHLVIDNDTLKLNNDGKLYADIDSVNIEDASTTQKGIVQLTTTIDDSEDVAPTPKAVKDYVADEISKLGIVEPVEESERIEVVSGSTVIPINIHDYKPTERILLLFDNTTKVFSDTYTIQQSTTSTSGYELIFTNPLATGTYEIVTIRMSSLINDSSMFHRGSIPPTDTSLIWSKTP